ncbi:MAG TPA: hypothetical protein VM888_02745 [Chitinophagaceae bacterium]|nr:hypothetical protein [Chitinophagaceae bacterium]
MTSDPKNPRTNQDIESGNTYETLPDQTSRREGGDDALAETASTDSRADEKVIVNEQREHKAVNSPSQTAANTSEETGSEEDIVNDAYKSSYHLEQNY